MLAGFPPLPYYDLESVDADATARDLEPVVRSRTFLGSPRDFYRLWWLRAENPMLAYRAWLTAAGGRATQAACALAFDHDVVWRNAAALQQIVDRDRSVVARDFAAMVRELVGSGAVLRGDAKTMKPNVRVILDDARGDRHQPLPKPEELLGHRPLPKPCSALN